MRTPRQAGQDFGRGFVVSAVVAAQAAVAAVEGEGDAAVGAAELVAAVAADEEGGVGAAVEEEDGLLASRSRAPIEALAQVVAQEAGLAHAR